MSFHVGQKVICVKTCKYTIRERLSLWWHDVVTCPLGFVGTVCNVYVADDGTEMIELTELPSPERGGWISGFMAKVFRPLVERKTDISVFTKMLRTEEIEA